MAPAAPASARAAARASAPCRSTSRRRRAASGSRARRGPGRAWRPASPPPANRCRPRAGAAPAPTGRPAARPARRGARRRRSGAVVPDLDADAQGRGVHVDGEAGRLDTRAPTRRATSIDGRGSACPARRASILNEAGRSRAMAACAASTAAAPSASRSGVAGTWRAMENETRPKTRSRRAAASSASVGRRTRTRTRPCVGFWTRAPARRRAPRGCCSASTRSKSARLPLLRNSSPKRQTRTVSTRRLLPAGASIAGLWRLVHRGGDSDRLAHERLRTSGLGPRAPDSGPRPEARARGALAGATLASWRSRPRRRPGP